MTDRRLSPHSVRRSIVALALTAFSLYLAFRQIALASILDAIRAANPWWLLAAIGGMLVAHYSRALRWRAMLRSLSIVHPFSAFSAVMIGYGINQVVPRGGELVRPYVLGRRENMPMSTLLATVVVERVIDVASLVLALLLSVWISTANIGEAVGTLFSEHHAATISDLILRVTLPTLAGLALLLWVFFTHRGLAMLEWIVRRGPARYQARLTAMIAHFRDGLRIVRSSGQVEWIAVWTVGVWVGYGLMTWFPLYALHLGRYGLTFGDAFALMSIITVGRTIAPTPGAIGVYHYFCIQGMMLLWHVTGTDAAAFATVSHGILYLAMILIGAGLWLWEAWRMRERTRI